MSPTLAILLAILGIPCIFSLGFVAGVAWRNTFLPEELIDESGEQQ